MALPVAAEGDTIEHTDGTVGVIVTGEKTVKVQNLNIATEGDVCSLHGGAIVASVGNVFAQNKKVAVGGDTVACTPSPGVIVITSGRTVFVGS